jgi:hypothetical protein
MEQSSAARVDAADIARQAAILFSDDADAQMPNDVIRDSTRNHRLTPITSRNFSHREHGEHRENQIGKKTTAGYKQPAA